MNNKKNTNNLKKTFFLAIIATSAFSACAQSVTQQTEINIIENSQKEFGSTIKNTSKYEAKKESSSFSKFVNDPNFCAMFMGTSDHEEVGLDYTKSLNAAFKEFKEIDGKMTVKEAFSLIEKACLKKL